MANELEARIIQELEKFLDGTSAVCSAFICKKVVEGFERYIADAVIADFKGSISSQGLFANDILYIPNPEVGPNPKIARLESRSVVLGKRLMKLALTECFGVNPAAIPKKELRNHFDEAYGVYKLMSEGVLGIVERRYKKMLGSTGIRFESDSGFVAGLIASHSIPYVGNPNLYFSKN